MSYVAVQKEFWHRVDEWLPQFCAARGYAPAGFRRNAKAVSDIDADDFLRAIDSGIVTVDDANNFHAPMSKASEHIFWEHPRKTTPGPITLWIEPIITIATAARLHFDYGWPIE